MRHTEVPEFITAAQAAKLKGITRATVYNAIQDGRLAHQKIAGRIVLDKAAVLAWQSIGRTGRPKGIPVSAEVRQRIAVSRKARWQNQKSQAKAMGKTKK